ncbi:hypothetical protein DSO57_1002081 [Entomophthora muscae]|uniref:Uncharacterized protein n=1 Tax=Entomophthora muscae TaxID=34485 RepID=A0ACC2RZR2_9FUNG|nr:hypothetical protein DSO57_1002081 [Entomophthora muscae]
MQAKYKLLTNPSPLLENDDSSKPVPGYNPGHTMGTGDQEPHSCASPSPSPIEPLLVRPNMLFYLLTYLVGYYLLGRFSSMMGRFAYLGHFGHLAMVTVPIGLVIAGLNVGALAHQIGNLFPLKWVPDRQ